jgi:hypothetical protein
MLLLSLIVLLTPFGYTNRINMEMKAGLSAAVLEVLNKDNYMAWSVRVKTYLMAKDLWDTIEATSEPPKQEDDEIAFKDWCEKNSMALNMIQVSCGPDALSVIRQISSAKIAWNTLAGLSLSLSLSLSLFQNVAFECSCSPSS